MRSLYAAPDGNPSDAPKVVASIHRSSGAARKMVSSSKAPALEASIALQQRKPAARSLQQTQPHSSTPKLQAARAELSRRPMPVGKRSARSEHAVAGRQLLAPASSQNGLTSARANLAEGSPLALSTPSRATVTERASRAAATTKPSQQPLAEMHGDSQRADRLMSELEMDLGILRGTLEPQFTWT